MKQQLQLSEALERIKPADVDAMRRAESRQLSFIKPVGALGRLEEVSIRLAGIYGDEKPSVRA